MKRYAAGILVVVAMAALVMPCQAQFLKKLEQNILGGQGQGQGPGGLQQPTLVGNVNLPPGQYMMTNVQTGQGFYVAIQAGQMYLTSGQQQMAPQMMAPGQGYMQPQQGGAGGLVRNFLRNELAPQQQGLPQQQMQPMQQFPGQ
jgi:hypothetical protein